MSEILPLYVELFLRFRCAADATRRGLGTKMLDKPNKLERLVSQIAAATALPLTVKIRTGQNASKINVQKARGVTPEPYNFKYHGFEALM